MCSRNCRGCWQGGLLHRRRLERGSDCLAPGIPGRDGIEFRECRLHRFNIAAPEGLLCFRNRPLGPASANASLERRPRSGRHWSGRGRTRGDRDRCARTPRPRRCSCTALGLRVTVFSNALPQIRCLDVVRIQGERVRDRTLSLLQVARVERPLRPCEVRHQLPKGDVGRGHRMRPSGRANVVHDACLATVTLRHHPPPLEKSRVISLMACVMHHGNSRPT